jgi:hypothetical protein
MSLRRLLAFAFLPLLLLAACTSDDDGDEGTDTTAAEDGTADSDVDLSALPAYENITAMNTDLAAAGITCTLEYEGLVDDTGKEVSLCTIDGQQAQLTRYPDSTTVEALVSTDTPIGAIAYGQNWTVQVDTPATAEAIATALGGETITADAATATTAAPTTLAPTTVAP